MENNLYYRYSRYLIERYGEKVYKMPINIPVSCPNRMAGASGCTYCGEAGAGFENMSSAFSVHEQITRNMEFYSRRFGVGKFIAYFQSFTNTFTEPDKFREYMESACVPGIVEISVSTRPDCVSGEYLSILKKIREDTGVNVTLELGLQSVNPHTLQRVNRGHALGEYIDAHLAAREYGFQVCTHMILNLPGDDMTDAVEGAKILSALKTDYVKLHSLYILKDTKMGEEYFRGEINVCSEREYKERVIAFLEHLRPETAVERILGRGPKEETVFSNWGKSWWRIRDEIEEEMKARESFQGKSFDYLDGGAVRRFF